MSQHDDFDRSLGRWFEAEAHPAATADVLDRALGATSHRRPRPGLFAALGSHWVGDSVGPGPGAASLGRTGLRTSMALLLLLLVLALVAGAVLVGARLLQPAPVRPAPADLGIFAPVAGRIVYRDRGGISGVDPAAPDAPTTSIQLTSEAGIPLAWSSDGTRLLIKRDQLLFVLHADGSETEVTVPGADAISPDLSRVVFGAPVGECCERMAVYAADVDGGPAEVLVEVQDLDMEEMTFSPDGTRIAYVVGSGDHSHRVWLMDADGSHAHQVLANDTTLGAGHVHGLAWAPAGDRIALELEGGIYTFLTDGSDFTRIAGVEGSSCGSASECAFKLRSAAESPYWSPDGSQIAYATGCFDGAANRTGCHLAIANADGSGVLEISFGLVGPWHPGTLAEAATPSD